MPETFSGPLTWRKDYDLFSLDVCDPPEAFRSYMLKNKFVFNKSSDFTRGVAAAANVHVDWKETPHAYIFKADLPGVKKEAVKIGVVDGQILEISGENRKEEEEDEKYHCVERVRGRFLRRFRLPEDANGDEGKAAMEDGVVTVTVPKLPQSKPVESSG